MIAKTVLAATLIVTIPVPFSGVSMFFHGSR